MTWHVLLLLAVIAILVSVWVGSLLRRRPGTLRTDEGGLLVARSSAHPLYLAWEEIEGFGAVTPLEIVGGLARGGTTRYVGVRLKDGSPMRLTRACEDNRRLSDYDILLSPEWGMSAEQFTAHLQSEMGRFKKG